VNHNQAAATPTTIDISLAPLFGPLQPVQTFMPVIRPAVGLTPQEALVGLLTTGALAPTILGQAMTLSGATGAASQLAGQLRALGFFTGLAVPPAFLFTPQPPPVSAGTIPFPAPGTPVQPISPLFQGLTALGNFLLGGPTVPTNVPTPAPLAQPIPTAPAHQQ
jgi:hypothetical protein